MRSEKDFTLYTQITWQHDGSISVTSIVETCIVDVDGEVVGVKQPSHSVNRNIEGDAELVKLFEKIADLPVRWRADDLAAAAAASAAAENAEAAAAAQEKSSSLAIRSGPADFDLNITRPSRKR